MAKYSIDSSTLTALGDAVRIHSPEKDGPNYLGPIGVLKSPNAIDANNYNRAVFNSSTRNQFQASKKALNDVAKIKVKLNYKTYASKPGFQDYEFQMRVYDTAYTTPYPLLEEEIVPTLILDLADEEIKSVEFEINSNEITLALVPYKTPSTSGGEFSFPMFFYAEIEYLDKNNNHIDYYDIIKVKNTMTPQIMIETINDFKTMPEEALTITGNCDYAFSNDKWGWFLNKYSDEITLIDITSATSMFNGSSNLLKIPTVGLKVANVMNLNGAWQNCKNLKEINIDINGTFTSSTTNAVDSTFAYCYSLRHINGLDKWPAVCKGQSIFGLYNTFNYCYCLDELINIPFIYSTYSGSYQFGSAFSQCSRLKDLIFKPSDDGATVVAPISGATLNLTTAGFTSIDLVNWGIPAGKEVIDDATYQALKDDPDWWSRKSNYSRYNHDSAVRTINSLPDCSATGTNTITFKGTAGSLTDGGAINTLTEEEIAVASAKGWTVSFT